MDFIDGSADAVPRTHALLPHCYINAHARRDVGYNATHT